MVAAKRGDCQKSVAVLSYSLQHILVDFILLVVDYLYMYSVNEGLTTTQLTNE